jgi:predicted transcriptional regulator
LKLARTIIAFSFILVIAISFAAIIQKQKNAAFSITTSKSPSQWTTFGSTTYNLLTFPTFTHHWPTFLTPFILDFNVAETPASILNNSTRVEIYDFIKANPGVQFRGICNQLGLSIGLAEFHLGVLKKAGLISFIRDGRYKRFFEAKKFSKKEMEIISLLRHDTARSILKTMLERKQISHSELASQLSITSQGLTWQMNRLKKDGVIQESKDGMKAIYSLEEAYAPMLTETINLIEQT